MVTITLEIKMLAPPANRGTSLASIHAGAFLRR
jgi:hypothetical protein